MDELLVYYGEGREAYWALHDSSGDIAAVVIPGTQQEDYVARVVAQQRYDAYGQVLAADHIHPHAFLAAGHKGLFYDRFDRGVSDEYMVGSVIPPNGGTVETPRLVPFARGVYHVRNRAMLPGGGSPTEIGKESLFFADPIWLLSQAGLSSGATVHGRFMQADPNATGMVLITSAPRHGGVRWPRVDDFALEVGGKPNPNEKNHIKYIDNRSGKRDSGGRRGHIYYLTYDGP